LRVGNQHNHMKFHAFFKTIFVHSRLLRLTCTASTLLTVSACTSLDSVFRQRNSPLPIESIPADSRKVSRVRAYETSDRLFVAGSIKTEFAQYIPASAHVDVQLIGSSGRVIAEKQDDIDPVPQSRLRRGRSRQISYVATFPLEIARKATSIRVTYHPSQHPSNSLGRTQH